jgi:siroheme synthase-like protein
MANSYLPINLDIRNRRILVVGGGNVALRKIETLLDFESDIRVIAPEPNEKIEYYASKGQLTIEKRGYASPEASEYGLVISASNDEAVNLQVSEDCNKAGVLVNVTDNPLKCSFIFPALLQRDCLTVAISTDGKAPFLAAHLRLMLENIFPAHRKKIASLAADFRKKVRSRWSENVEERFAALDRFLSADWKTLIKSKNDKELEGELDQLLDPVEAAGSDNGNGKS